MVESPLSHIESDSGRSASEPAINLDAEDPGRSLQTPARVLVVDDVEANRRLIATLLTRDGYMVEFATDGRAAVDRVMRDAPTWC